ncbi:TlyA family RNA methyltransferase, partial [Microbacteriaceae bacterium K1510]|nr:TlyA family RNA methyltransferase [Microbacteriaceae bacterium K1510]
RTLSRTRHIRDKRKSKRSRDGRIGDGCRRTLRQAWDQLAEDVAITVKGEVHPYVSRGGLKLEKALRSFGIDLNGKVMMDIGASTGGFTDCALQHGARRVYAIDVGYGQLAWSLRQDERVVVMERTNFRHLEPQAFQHEHPNAASIDVSFISLK